MPLVDSRHLFSTLDFFTLDSRHFYSRLSTYLLSTLHFLVLTLDFYSGLSTFTFDPRLLDTIVFIDTSVGLSHTYARSVEETKIVRELPNRFF